MMNNAYSQKLIQEFEIDSCVSSKGYSVNQPQYAFSQYVEGECNPYYFPLKLEKGKWTAFFMSDTNRRAAVLEYNNEGYREGESIFYFPNGNLSAVIRYKNGEREGKAYFYYPNGNIKIAFNFHRDKEDSLQYSYYDTGELFSIVNYNNGEKEGESKVFFKNLRVKEHRMYDSKEKKVTVIIYNERGKVERKEQYQNEKRIDHK